MATNAKGIATYSDIYNTFSVGSDSKQCPTYESILKLGLSTTATYNTNQCVRFETIETSDGTVRLTFFISPKSTNGSVAANKFSIKVNSSKPLDADLPIVLPIVFYSNSNYTQSGGGYGCQLTIPAGSSTISKDFTYSYGSNRFAKSNNNYQSAGSYTGSYTFSTNLPVTCELT